MKKNVWAIVVNLAAVVVAIMAFDVWRHAQPVPGMGHRIDGTSALNFYEIVDDVGYLPWPGRSAPRARCWKARRSTTSPTRSAPIRFASPRARPVPAPAS